MLAPQTQKTVGDHIAAIVIAIVTVLLMGLTQHFLTL